MSAHRPTTDDRIALLLAKHGAELDYAEIARRMGGTEAAARANVHQATNRLKRELR
jgi:DNA-directed RNA polymerase specialized sigma24 family protein